MARIRNKEKEKLYYLKRKQDPEWVKLQSRKAMERYYSDPEKFRLIRLNRKDKIKNAQLKRYYGITLEYYNQMLKKQDYKCAICRKESTKSLVVDHCHKSGKVRGLLCSDPCNIKLMCIIDNYQDLIEKGLSYKNGKES